MSDAYRAPATIEEIEEYYSKCATLGIVVSFTSNSEHFVISCIFVRATTNVMLVSDFRMYSDDGDYRKLEATWNTSELPIASNMIEDQLNITNVKVKTVTVDGYALYNIIQERSYSGELSQFPPEVRDSFIKDTVLEQLQAGRTDLEVLSALQTTQRVIGLRVTQSIEACIKSIKKWLIGIST